MPTSSGVDFLNNHFSLSKLVLTMIKNERQCLKKIKNYSYSRQ